MSRHADRWVLGGLQILVLAVPALLGGMHPSTLRLAVPLALALLGVTLVQRARRPDEAGETPGVCLLAAFLALALVTTVPLPPAVLAWFAPATARLYGETLPDWPASGAWRPLAWDPWATWVECLRIVLGFATFTVVVAYPWEGDAGRRRVAERLLGTALAGGLVFALVGVAQQVAGNGQALWITDAPNDPTRLAGPFVNPNHFATWLEMLVPVALAWAVLVARRVRARLARSATGGRAAGVNARRAWASALLANQRRLWMPVLAVFVVAALAGAHAATASRGGRVALAVGVAFTVLGLVGARGGRTRLVHRAAPAIAVAVLALAGGVLVALARDAVDAGGAAPDAHSLDVDTGSRLAVAALGARIVGDHPLVGTGLGSWLHAFRPYQGPPVEDGIWDHAHNDYLELAAETGAAGVLVALLFGFAVVRAVRSGAPNDGPDGGDHRPAAFDAPDWRAAPPDAGALRWGIAGGVLAVLVHSLAEFGLRMPGNLVLLMAVLGVAVLLGRVRPARRRMAPVALAAVAACCAALPVVDALRVAAGRPSLDPARALELADARLAGDDDPAGAEALVRWAIARSPADRDAHRQLAAVAADPAVAEAALRRAIALDRSAAELRNELALALWERGRRVEAAAEIEEAIFRWPHLETHAYLSPESGIFPSRSTGELLREITDGDTLDVRLALLEPEMADAVERGLRRALAASEGGETRALVTRDVIALLEARGRWAESAQALRAEGELRADDGEILARAARDYLRAGDLAAAEEALLRAIARTPEHGTLYRMLAVDVYAARGDFATADMVLESAARNATDMVPVYRGVTDVLARREAARREAARSEPLVGAPGGPAS